MSSDINHPPLPPFIYSATLLPDSRLKKNESDMERATWKNLVIFPIGYQWSPGNLASETTRRRTRRTVKQRLHGSMNDSCLLLYRHERVITRVLPTERSSGACGIKLCHCFMETFLGKTVSRKAAFQDRFIPFREREKSPSSP